MRDALRDRVPGEDLPTSLAQLIGLASLKSTSVIATVAAVVSAGAVGVGAWYVARTPEPATTTETARVAAPEAPAASTAARSEPQTPAAAPAPSFDVARIESTGEAVIAGRAAPGAKVELLRDGQVHDQTVADKAGEFVLIPKPLPPGAYDLSLRATQEGGAQTTSKDSVAVALGTPGTSGPVVALVAPDKPAQVLSRPPLAATTPQPATPPAAAPLAASPPATAVAPAAPPPRNIPSQPPPKPATSTALKIAIDAVESESSGKMYVSGRSAPGASVRLYLNDSYIAQATASAQGKVAFAIESGVRPGDYQVRLDEVDPAGKVTSRAEVPFNAPVLSKPAVASEPARRPAEETALAAATPPPAAAKPSAPAAAPVTAAPPASDAPKAATPRAPPATTPATSMPPVAPGATASSAPTAVSSSDAQRAAAAEPPSVVVVAKIDTAVVSRGDSLWRISRETYGRGARYSVIYQANQNQIRDPDLIYPGQIFVLPTQQ